MSLKEKGLVTAAAVGIGALVLPNLARVINTPDTNPGNQDASDIGVKIESHSISNTGLVSSKGGESLKVTYKFNHGEQGIKDMVDKDFPDQDITEAVNNITTYLPESDQKNKIIHPNEEVTVDIDSHGNVIPNPTSDDSASNG